MPIFQLTKELVFPHPSLSEADGLLAFGGDLSTERLLLAYSNGIFPWYNPEEPILWWSPEPRTVFFPDEFKLTKSLKQTIRSKKFEVKFDTCFEEVIRNCSSLKNRQDNETWLGSEMQQAYILLHKKGFAHSVETFYKDELVGGLYGISLGRVFFGESMFYRKSDASKIALYYLCQKLIEHDFHFIDAQMTTNHILSLGASELTRNEYLKLLSPALQHKSIIGKWTIYNKVNQY
ncbi:MAG: leucyl/phenylalanyl-tRNA--protein transferase [Bacteroidetes bacterium]|jgi:leucyl/phenylalanyl-tRNA--protein transferase|nr:leucyl/phenylalanyl-tRNA--protein transferase [Bacteroidota bacterium]MBT6685797.1 leucyl/phenylalanyl-tRNA--protein transferase [Bacteroidota bacterium]MBT7143709.1 leucyl/phenylalanyl-tRNA--protein transferase [Bacteroidota bacterium]MBT7491936.1 leucyl/phenylalanyl-tRNA--protein transferase [Bacteroidota bacterium]